MHRVLVRVLLPLHMIAASLAAGPAWAGGAEYLIPENGDSVIGTMTTVIAEQEDTILDIARRNGIGYEEIMSANPGVDPWIPGAGTEILIPSRYVLPDAPREGVVINLAEHRLYYYPPAKKGERRVVRTYPISTGKMDWKTPIGVTRIVSKQEKPNWYPPASVLAEHEANGDPLPKVVPPGPDNPLGEHAMRLGIPGGAYLIHGTNRPYGIGMRVTHGCVRLYPEDVEELFKRVPVGTRVLMLDAPFKAGWKDNVLYVEAHPAFNEEAEPEPHKDISPMRQVVLDAVRGQPHSSIDWTEIDLIARQATGVPVATSIRRSHAVAERAPEPEAAAPAPAPARPAAKTAVPTQPSTRPKDGTPQAKAPKARS